MTPSRLGPGSITALTDPNHVSSDTNNKPIAEYGLI